MCEFRFHGKADRIFNIGDVWVENSGRQRDELHRWRNPLPTQRTKPSQIGSKPSSKVALFFICAKYRGHEGKQNQAPKQVLGVVTLHAVCEE